MDYRVALVRAIRTWRLADSNSCVLRSWALACSLAACGSPAPEHPLEGRARRVVVAGPRALAAAGELHDFPAALCQQYCPEPSVRAQLSGCFQVLAPSSDEQQRIAPGAKSLISCNYAEAR